MAIKTNHFSILNHLVIWGTIVLYFITASSVPLLPALKMCSAALIFVQLSFWSTTLLTCTTLVLITLLANRYYVRSNEFDIISDQNGLQKDSDETKLNYISDTDSY